MEGVPIKNEDDTVEEQGDIASLIPWSLEWVMAVDAWQRAAAADGA